LPAHLHLAEMNAAPALGDPLLPPHQLSGNLCTIRCPPPVGVSRWLIDLLHILFHHSYAAVARGELSHAGLDLCHPGGWDTLIVPLVEEGYHLLLQQTVEVPGIHIIPLR